MALLREFVTLDYDKALIKEAKEKGEPVVLKKALMQRYDAPNQNRRIYPRPILEREISRYKKIVEENRAVGECDHPDDSVVNLRNVSHIIRDIWEEGDNVMGDVEILSTPSGNIIKSLMESGVRIGISSRGVGDTNRNDEGYDVVSEDFNLIAFDLVSEPSTYGAFLSEGLTTREAGNKIYRVNSILDSILKKQ